MADNKKKHLARKSSQNPDSPYYVDDKEAKKDAGPLTVVECMRLARIMKDNSQLPDACRRYVESHARLKRATSGLSQSDTASVIDARKSGRLNHAQLQRRWTSRENPLAERKKTYKMAQQIAAQEIMAEEAARAQQQK